MGMLETAAHLQLLLPHVWGKASLVTDVPRAMETTLTELQKMPFIPKKFTQLYDELCALCVIDFLFSK
jgi:hypothetical protein